MAANNECQWKPEGWTCAEWLEILEEQVDEAWAEAHAARQRVTSIENDATHLMTHDNDYEAAEQLLKEWPAAKAAADEAFEAHRLAVEELYECAPVGYIYD